MESAIGDEHYVYDDNHEAYAEHMRQDIAYLGSEYAYEISRNSELQIDKQKLEIAKRRRISIISYYDRYMFKDYNINIDDEYNYDEIMANFNKFLEIGIDEDYKHISISIRDEEVKRLEKEEQQEMMNIFENTFQNTKSGLYRTLSAWDDDWDHIQNALEFELEQKQKMDALDELHETGEVEIIEGNINNKALIPPPPPKDAVRRARRKSIDMIKKRHSRRRSIEYMNQSSVLYAVDPADEIKEKEWMKKLKTKKFKIYMNQKKYQMLQIKKIEFESRIQEMKTQVLFFVLFDD